MDDDVASIIRQAPGGGLNTAASVTRVASAREYHAGAAAAASRTAAAYSSPMVGPICSFM